MLFVFSMPLFRAYIVANLQLCFGLLLLVQSPAFLVAQEPIDVWFSTQSLPGTNPKHAVFNYNGELIGRDEKAFETIIASISEFPRGSSIVWGPNYRRCGACSGSEPGCLPKHLFPELWEQLENVIRTRGLHLSSLYPGPFYSSKEPKQRRILDKGVEYWCVHLDWSNYRGEETIDSEVVYYLDGRFMGLGDDGFEKLLLGLVAESSRYWQTRVVIPTYQLGGKWATEFFNENDLDKLNAKFKTMSPFAKRRNQLEETCAKLNLILVLRNHSLGAPRDANADTVHDWAVSSIIDMIDSAGRIVTHDARPTAEAMMLEWRDFDASLGRHKLGEHRRPESTAMYVVNGQDVGRGVDGFSTAMQKIEGLRPGSTVGIKVCIRTQAPFTCPILLEGKRHFEITGYEPYQELLPWLLHIARVRSLQIEWLPDQSKSIEACELNK